MFVSGGMRWAFGASMGLIVKFYLVLTSAMGIAASRHLLRLLE